MKLISINEKTLTVQPEIVACDMCEGNGKREQGISCPLMFKPVRGKVGKSGNNHCPHCDSPNRHKHTMIGTEIVECWQCKGTGKHVESLSFNELIEKGWLNNLKFYFGRQAITQDSRAMQIMFGADTLTSCTDYGRFFNFIRAKLPKDTVKTYGDLFELPFFTHESTGVYAEIYAYIVKELNHASISGLYLKKRDREDMEPVELHREILMEIGANGYRFIGAIRK